MCAKHQKRSNDADAYNLSAEEFAQHILDWLKCADDDLASAKLLYHNKHYSNSLYHLQQSVEKATKAFGLGLKLVHRPSDMRKKIGHKPLNLIGIGTGEYYNRVSEMPKEYQILGNDVGQSLIEWLVNIYAKKMDVSDSEQDLIRQNAYTEFKNRSTKGVDYLKKSLKSLPKTQELEFYFKEMKITKEMLLETPPIMEILNDDKSDFSEFVKSSALSSLRHIYTANNLASEDEFNSEVETNNQLIDYVCENFLCKFVYLFCLNNYIWSFIIALSAITGTLEENTRYPKPKDLYNPLKQYSEEYILVRMFEELVDYTGCLLASLYHYFELSNDNFKEILEKEV